MAVQVAGKRPAHWRTQFRDVAETRRSDCGVWACLNARDVVTDHKLAVGPTKAEGRQAVRLARQMMGDESGPTSTDDWYAMFTSEALRVSLKGLGLALPKVSRLSGAPWARVREHLAAGRVVLLCVDYGELRKGNAPVDSSSFAGGHAIAMHGYRRPEGGVVRSTIMDSLLSSPYDWNVSAYREAAGRFGLHPWGVGRIEALSVAPCKPLAQEPPVEPPVDPWRGVLRAYDDLGAAIASMRGIDQ